MSTHTVTMPYGIAANFSSIQFFLNQYNDLLNSGDLSNELVIFDLTKTKFISAEMVSLFGALIEKLKLQGALVQIDIINSKPFDVLSRNGFLKQFNMGKNKTDPYGTTIPYFSNYSQDDTAVVDFLQNHVFGNNNWPHHLLNNAGEIEVINTAILELSRNIYEHSGSNTLYMCGQFFPQKQRIRFMITDTGVSIPFNVEKHTSIMYKNDYDYIRWAVQRGNSTKNTPASGLGLFEIANNLMHGGEFTIISRTGYWKQNSSGSIILKTLVNPLPGTSLHLEFLLNNRSPQATSNQALFF
ncbi:histidine kinase [Furfurilactobacillus entadae]|uniref:hypothetical protein n=1 Tax=Furfurilactobacillus entadae TaxID=2922307 RepID=UPI0035EF9C99